MNFIKKHKGKIIGSIILVAILVFAFCWGGGAPDGNGVSEETPSPTPVATAVATEVIKTPDPTPKAKPTPNPTATPVATVSVATEAPVERTTCTLSVRCDTILDNMTSLDPTKAEIIPQNGVIYGAKVVEFTQGESVFDVLLREMRNRGIHFEFESAPIYGSAYIEGIANIYEFDCGAQSGWMYKVNGVFPRYGCSNYIISKGDRIEFVYTCSSGKDIGGSNY